VIPWLVPSVYGALSVVAFVAYGLDKSAARRGAARTRESTLLVLGLAGGWPGAFVAQQVFRHKTRKIGFQLAFWLTVAANCAALWWWWRR
jgi:uncharacterized membrane protein YsdA (DUF1294 family)